MVITLRNFDTFRDMKALQVIGEIMNRVFKWHRVPVSLRAGAVLLYFKGLSLRTVSEFLLHKGYKVSIEALREWFHAVGRNPPGNIYDCCLGLCG
jgi:transposase-like protein